MLPCTFELHDQVHLKYRGLNKNCSNLTRTVGRRPLLKPVRQVQHLAFPLAEAEFSEYGETAVLARLYGFSLHAATVCEAHQHNRLEWLCRYITRPPIATRRLSVDGLSRVLYRYKRPFRDG